MSTALPRSSLHFAALALGLAVALCAPAAAQQGPAVPWPGRTAYLGAPGRLEVGLLHPLRWTVHPRFELSTHLWLFPLNPNLQLKFSLKQLTGEIGALQLSTLHTVNYPSPWLRAVAREGAGGLLPATSTIPAIVATTHHLLASRSLAPGVTLTTRVGIRIAWRAGEVDMPTLDLPLLYPRTAPYHGRFVFQGGVAVNGWLGRRFGIVGDANFLAVPAGAAASFSFEQMTLGTWHASPRFAVGAGYQFVYAGYPFGTDLHVFPVVDLYWLIRR